jgi:hypothetical protein
VRFLPPLNVKPEEIQAALGIFGEALAEVFGEPSSQGSGSRQDLNDVARAAIARSVGKR